MNWQYLIPITAFTLFAIKKFFTGLNYNGPIPDLTGKNAVLTGGNTGIGKETLLVLAKSNCNVVIGARDKDKSLSAVKAAQALSSSGRIQFIPLDLADKESIRQFAEAIPFDQIDYLINNAGLMSTQRSLTKDGFQMDVGCNHFGHFLLTSLLWPRLLKSKFFRIVNVSSLAHRKLLGFGKEPTIDFEDINLSKNFQFNNAYSRSKLCNNLFTHALANRIDDKKGLVVSLHPGVVRTELARSVIKGAWEYVLMGIYPLYWLVSKSVKQGSQTTQFALFSPNAKNGGYYADCRPSKENSFVKEENWEKLWTLSQQMWGIQFGAN